MKKIVIVDDHPVVNYAISGILSATFPDIDIQSVLSAREFQSLVNDEFGVASNATYLMAFVDINLPDADGIELMQELRTHYGIPVIAISSDASSARVQDCVNLGAVGFIEKTAKLEIYPAAVNFILAGGMFFPAEYRKTGPALPLRTDPASSLTARQREVFGLLLDGQSNKRIGAKLGLSEGTVKNHVSALLKLFNVDSRSQLMANTTLNFRFQQRLDGARISTVSEAM